jgi:glycosyltransferase involved in cell wall biosynthesis
MDSIPRVSIGLIVYNGENFLAEAINSLLAQTFTDFELIISDNCSTDKTESICRDYASRDARIRYYRADENYGATWNHNNVIDLARGEFFKLAAHDDLCEPRFIEACVNALDADQQAILAFTDAKLLRGNFRASMRLHRHTLRTDANSAATRFDDMIDADLQGFQVFGCIRTDILRDIKPFGPWKGADRLVMAELALRGSFARVEECLFIYRLHPQQSISLVNQSAEYTAWWRSGETPERVFPQWRFLRELAGMVWRVPMAVREKWRCLRHIGSWGWNHRRDLIREIKGNSK